MIKVKCIQKFRDKNNNIYGYRIQDTHGNIQDVKPEPLKLAIKNNQLIVINLTLTSDNRLIEKADNNINTNKTDNTEQDIAKLIRKSLILGLAKEIPTACHHKCYLVSLSETNYNVYIPNNVTQLNQTHECLIFTKYIQDLQGTLKVVGGHKLTDANNMFRKCQAQSIDLSSFDTSEVRNMEAMFYGCQAQSLALSSFNTSKVKDMYAMFCRCQAKSIELSSFDTSNVIDMVEMFDKCQAQSLDLSSFNTSKVTDMNNMFCECQAQSIDLSSFDTSKVTDMGGMFWECQAQSIDLSSFNTSKVKTMEGMFNGCKAKSLDLSSFDTSNVTNIWKMFDRCQAQIKATDKGICRNITLEKNI